MRVLIIHHLEKYWEDGYNRVAGTTFEALQERFVQYLEFATFDKVILTRFEDWTAPARDGYFEAFTSHLSDIHQYAYGWDSECIKGCEEMFCEGGNHSEYVLIDDWMLKLKGCEVTISGAFDGECVEDLEIALSHLEIEFRREESLII